MLHQREKKKVGGRYCRNALEVALIFLFILWQRLLFGIVKILKLLREKARMCRICSEQGVHNCSFLMHLVINIRRSAGMLHEACGAFRFCYYCNTERIP